MKNKYLKKHVLLLLFGVLFSTLSYGQTISKVFENTPLKSVLKEIENQTGLSIIYEKNEVNEKKIINKTFENTPVKNVLSEILDKSLSFSIENKMITIFPSKRNDLDKQGQSSGAVTKKISGVIVDAAGEPLIGAVVNIKGTTKSAVADYDGNFNLDAAVNDLLVITYIGYQPVEVTVATSNNYNITLKEDTKLLDEVVVVGYGIQKKSDITGSVTSVKASELLSAPTTNAAQALQGRAAGVVVQNSSGTPSSDVTIRIRGANSLTYGNDPLTIIDGVQGGNIGVLNPNDIESIEILKDAAALSIYGSRGANGVIIVTTKTGKSGAPQVSYNTFLSFDKVRRKLPSMNAQDYARLFNEAKIENGQNPIEFPTLDRSTNWQDEIFRNAFSQSHNVSVSGTKKDISYFVSGSMVDKEGVVKNTDFTQYSLRSNLRVQATSRLLFSINAFLSKDEGKNGDASSAITSALQWSPTKSVYDENSKGGYTQPGGGVGPVALFNPVGYAQEIVDNWSSTAYSVAPSAEFKITDYLKVSSLFAYKSSSFDSGYFDNQVMNNGPSDNVYGSSSQGESSSIQNTNILTFDKKFGYHSITFTGVYEILKDKYKNTTISAKGIPVELGYDGVPFGTEQLKPQQEIYNTAMRSFMGRVNYSYKNRYMFSFSDRYDGASQLSDGNKFDNFMAGSIGWNVMEEPFMRGLVKIIPDLKLRASYGSVGNAAVPAYSSHMKFESGLDANGNPTLTLSQLDNKDLKWERTTETNVGLDARLFDGRLTFSAEYYYKKTKDLLMWQKVPNALGVESKLTNVGSVSNKGVDFSIGGTPLLLKDFTWNTNLTFNYNKNKILALDGMSDMLIYSSDADFPGLVGSFVQMVGQPMGTFLGYEFAGVWNESEKSTAAMYGVKPGDAKYVDQNRDGKIDSEDITVIGNAQPKCTFGWNNTFRYKDFELNIFWQGVYGNKIYNQNRIKRESYSSTFPTSPVVEGHWTVNNQNTNIPAFSGLEYVNSSRWVEDGSYLRLKNITLNYYLPKKFLTSTKVLSAAKIYISGSNLWTITDYKGFDPEASMGKDATAAGVDRGVYPSSKGFVVGVDITF